MHKRLTLPVALLGLSLLLSACGFQLRGLQDVPEPLRQAQLVVDSKTSQLERELRRTFSINGVQLDAGGRYRIELTRERHTRRAATLTGNADVAEYELRSEAWFRVLDTQDENRALIPEQRVMIERVYSNNPDNITASDSQEHLIRQQMQQELAQQILRQYISIRPSA